MTKEELEAERISKLRAIVKSAGITAVAKQIVADGRSSIDEHELTALATEDAQRAYPDLSPAQAFEKVYMADVALREAVQIAKETASLTPIVVDGNISNPNDAAAATAALTRLVEEQRSRAPWMSAEQVWDYVLRERPDLAARADPAAQEDLSYD